MSARRHGFGSDPAFGIMNTKKTGKLVEIVALMAMLVAWVAAIRWSIMRPSLPPTKNIAVTTSIKSDTLTAKGMILTSVCITATSPTPMATAPFLHGPLPGTGPMFSDETGRQFACPLFDYGNGPGAGY